jgi:plastocyanin
MNESTLHEIFGRKTKIRISQSNWFSALLHWMLLLAVLIVPQVLRATEWFATVGAQTTDKGGQALAFLPNEIWIHTGDSITWTWAADDVHTVTFLRDDEKRPPFFAIPPRFLVPSPATFDGKKSVSTPLLVEPTTFTVTFSKAGNYKQVCLVHENMTGAVHVLDPGEQLPHDQGFYDQQAADQRQDLLVSDFGEFDVHSIDAQVIAGIGEISATPGGSQTVSVVRFKDENIVIHAGQTVEWTNHDPVTPHTITFGQEPSNVLGPPSSNVTTDADGALHATINSPMDSVNSGLIVAALQEQSGEQQSPLGTTRFRVTFPNPGVFTYRCVLHDNLGMIGTVTVQ